MGGFYLLLWLARSVVSYVERAVFRSRMEELLWHLSSPHRVVEELLWHLSSPHRVVVEVSEAAAWQRPSPHRVAAIRFFRLV